MSQSSMPMMQGHARSEDNEPESEYDDESDSKNDSGPTYQDDDGVDFQQ